MLLQKSLLLKLSQIQFIGEVLGSNWWILPSCTCSGSLEILKLHSGFKVLIGDYGKNEPKPQKISWVQFMSYTPNLLRSQRHYVTKCEWYLRQTEPPRNHSQPSKAIFQPLVFGVKSLHVSSSHVCSNLKRVWLLQGFNQRRWLNFTSKSLVETDRIGHRGQWSKPQLYSCEPQGQESTFKFLFVCFLKSWKEIQRTSKFWLAV